MVDKNEEFRKSQQEQMRKQIGKNAKIVIEIANKYKENLKKYSKDDGDER